ncbi:hypothetical protein MPER_15668, partial [Moniliophthora perniciosa FA553]
MPRHERRTLYSFWLTGSTISTDANHDSVCNNQF